MTTGHHQNQWTPNNSSKKNVLLIQHGSMSSLSIKEEDWALFCWIGPSRSHGSTPTCRTPDEVARVQRDCKKSSSANIGAYLIHSSSNSSLLAILRGDEEFCSLLLSWRGASNAIVHLLRCRARTPAAVEEGLVPEEESTTQNIVARLHPWTIKKGKNAYWVDGSALQDKFYAQTPTNKFGLAKTHGDK